MATCFLTRGELLELLRSAPAERVFGPVATAHGTRFLRIDKDELDKLVLEGARPAFSPKSLLFPPRERVASYGKNPPSVDDPAEAGKTLAVGLCNCDLRALALLDQILLEGDFVDPFYAARRQSLITVGLDCTEPTAACFCVSVDGDPFITEKSDLAICPVKDGYIVDGLTDAGKELVVNTGKSFREPTAGELREREELREQVRAKVADQNSGFRVPADAADHLEKLEGSPKWEEESAVCVECAACSNICPTCHCFYLYDRPAGEEGYERIRVWDSCLYADYSRMAGVGGMKPNPRPELRSRLANRILHKYSYIPRTHGVLGCTGCGRCVEACFGGSDIRDVVARLLQ